MPSISKYRCMWLHVFFDLPVQSTGQRRAATEFRNNLLNLGFQMAQYSVYKKFCSSKDKAKVYIKKIKTSLTNEGNVHILTITDKQYENMLTFCGDIPNRKNKNPDQFLLFD